LSPAGPDHGHEDALHVHFEETGHTYRVHAGTRRQALVDELTKLRAATGRSDIKNLATVLARVKFLGADAPPASLAPLFALLMPRAAKYNWDFVRGAIATGVAVLRCTEMGIPQMKQWLDEEIKRRALGFTAVEAEQWFYECSKAKTSLSDVTVKMFLTFRPEPSTSLTEAVAKERVTQILDRAVVMKAGRPLTRSRRRG
jgi:hypothetical protein